MISIIVLSWNAADEVLACAESLLAMTGVDKEIIIIDNDSADNSVAELRKLAGIRLIENPTNAGYAGGNNQGFALAQGEFIWLLNQDTVVNEAACLAMQNWLKLHPSYGAVTTKLLNMDGTTQYLMHRRFPHWYDIIFAALYKRWKKFLLPTTKRYLYLDQSFDQDFDIEQAAGASMMVRRSAIEQLGMLFDERRFPLYYNDVDLSYRLHQAGWKIRCLCSVSIQHRKGTSVKKLPRFKNLLIYLRALAYFFGSRR